MRVRLWSTVVAGLLVSGTGVIAISAERPAPPEVLSFDWKAERADSNQPGPLEQVIAGLPATEIDATLLREIDGKQKLFIFQGDAVTRVDWATRRIETRRSGRRIREEFAGVGAARVDAVFGHAARDGRAKLYFFSGDSYWRYDIARAAADAGYPRSIAAEWPGVFDGRVDDALVAQPGTVYFFQGSSYLRYDFARDRVDPGYPRPIDERTWNGVWPSGVDAAFYDSRAGRAWFIKQRGLAKTPVYPDDNVIFITWDGVRSQEFFSGKSDPTIWKGPEIRLLERFWQRNAARGVVFGDPRIGGSMSIANPAGVSYPAYVTMLNGLFNAQCMVNEVTPACPRNWVETFPERLRRERGTERRDVPVFASWDRIADAVESRPEQLTVNAGLYPFTDPDHPRAHDAINAEQVRRFGPNPSFRAERPDDLTWAHAMTYLDNHRPKFMYIYLVDSDTVAHAGNYAKYAQWINQYDVWLDELIAKLRAMGEYGSRTTIVVTTDHGRGVGESWRHHGTWLTPEDKTSVERVWSYVIGPRTPGRGAVAHRAYSHLELRPSMEKLLGMQPLLGGERILREAFAE